MGALPQPFLKNWKKIPWFWKQWEGFRFSLQGFSFLCCRGHVYQSALILRNLPCSDKFLVMDLFHNDLSTGCFAKKSIHKFFWRKNHKNSKCIDFQFHNHKFSQKGITAATDIWMKGVTDSSLRGVLWRKVMETLKVLILTIILLNLVCKGLSFYYTVIFTRPSTK